MDTSKGMNKKEIWRETAGDETQQRESKRVFKLGLIWVENIVSMDGERHKMIVHCLL